MPRIVRWLTLGILGFVAAPACSDAFGVDDILGIWNTASINGYAVPGTVVYEGNSHDTQYVRWALYDGGLCTLTQQVDGSTETYDECDYTVNLEQETIAIAFLFETWDGRFDGDSMTLTDPQDVVWILRKQ
ncbi:MAG: hypothetical protein OEO20_05725 [Gemmatimonadota bacterium]|nr:hypothetical protein [Gemmatimonadota bacterium]MDH3366344.1 hypothetical protein [Gemmatimonadota bacterium]MDH3477784.1 hypothetical protein [Gemmatimonadota bacterium]MDH3570383.1 hypothetical protein [Gemmatimonadota bacterium]MDH5550272.1 hypothetical protein [Gemmatimonadota bacterium]